MDCGHVEDSHRRTVRPLYELPKSHAGKANGLTPLHEWGAVVYKLANGRYAFVANRIPDFLTVVAGV